MGYGLYRLVSAEAREEGHKQWPIKMLFSIGAVLAILAWVVLLLRDDRSGKTCYEASRFENGVLVPAREYECDHEVEAIGVPRSEDPGGEAHGVGSAAPIETETETDGE